VSQQDSPYLPANPLRQRLIIAAVGLVLVAVAGWLALIIVTRIDDLFFPGQSIPVGGLGALPGVQGSSDQQGQINFLVMGLDRRPREGNIATRTDTMFVLTIDKKTKAAGILGIPRDLWVHIPTKDDSGYYDQRINTAYAAGETEGYSGGGAALVKGVIERNLGISIDHYVVIDFQGFVKVIDDLGGIDIYVEQAVDDPYYSETELPGDYHPLHFEVGQQHMDGQTALDYSRTRFDSSDLDRIHRQQQVIFAAIDKATQQRLVNVNSLMSQWRRYKGAIDTDINDIQAPGFAALAAQIDPKDIAALSLGPATVPYTTPDGAEVLLIDKTIVQEIVAALFTGQQPEQATAVVEVQNGAGTDGLAEKVTNYLADFGFSPDSLTAASSASGVQALTEIIDFTGKASTAQRLAALLGVPVAQIRPATSTDLSLATVANRDVLVILGQDVKARNFSITSPDTQN
jgi:polyisoprenyl-teichoic acid--peptidoglycan teichoic acid transferase